MKLLSEACEYGLRAVVWLGQRPGQPQKVKEIAEGTQAAPGYLVKVLQDLARAEILAGRRGSQGGFTLLRPPAELTILEVINAIDPLERITSCPLQIQSHGQALCPLHRRIDDAIGMIEQSFRSTTIAELIDSPAASVSLCDSLCLDRQSGAK